FWSSSGPPPPSPQPMLPTEKVVRAKRLIRGNHFLMRPRMLVLRRSCGVVAFWTGAYSRAVPVPSAPDLVAGAAQGTAGLPPGRDPARCLGHRRPRNEVS